MPDTNSTVVTTRVWACWSVLRDWWLDWMRQGWWLFTVTLRSIGKK